MDQAVLFVQESLVLKRDELRLVHQREFSIPRQVTHSEIVSQVDHGLYIVLKPRLLALEPS